LKNNSDVLGTALRDFWAGTSSNPIITWTDLTDEDEMDPGYFFRTYEQMPAIEQHALDTAKGRTLDVGCGSGSHSLYLQQKGLQITGIDHSQLSVEVAKKRGLKNAVCQDFFDFNTGHFDTILLLMNGAGIAGRLKTLPKLFLKLEALLAPNGQVLVDSSDLIYLFEDHLEQVPTDRYYGELTFGIRYKDHSTLFPWLYIDYNLLAQCAAQLEWKIEKLLDGPNHDYLARLTKEY
jgi:SAM-dependent methyltransferase